LYYVIYFVKKKVTFVIIFLNNIIGAIYISIKPQNTIKKPLKKSGYGLETGWC